MVLLDTACSASALISPTSHLWVSRTLTPTSADLAAYDVCVLPAQADLSQAPTKPGGQLRFARVTPLVAAASVRWPHWVDFAVREVAEPLLGKGFDGWVVEGSDPRLVSFVKALKARHPDQWVFVRNAGLLDEKPRGIGLYLEAPAAEMAREDDLVRECVARGMPVLAVALGGEEPARIAAHLTELKAVPFVTTPDLSGISLAPLKERSRRVLVLYGWDPKAVEKPRTLPADTMTGELFQTPLEWLGYEADYLDVARTPLPGQIAARYAAVLVDAELQIPGERELAIAEWLARMKEAGVPVLFTGTLPFSSDDALRVFQEAFGLHGTLAAMPQARSPTIVSADPEFMRGEAKLTPHVLEFRDLQAPENSHVLLSLAANDTRFDPIFLAPWGGMWMEPYIVLRASQDSALFYADPYKILAAVLACHGPLPAPDLTTRDGRRLFYSHIDGDGFASLTDFRGHPFCGEVVRDRVLKVFPIPVTVSVVEADITAVAEGVEDQWGTKLADTARSIFALPNVRVASHSFSHPYQWDPQDPNPGIYTEPNMPLKPAARYPTIDIGREIRGSIGYINKELAPKNKPVELMLWSGNCRPGVAALRMVREMGIENMNGGNTIISRLYPGIAGIAPRVMQWGDELQINAANQNEFMYANGWNGPFYGGFADVIDTFERTESPRRVKPVNVYYHFYSATCLSSLRALEKIHRWCLEQPLHPVTAHDFATMTKDAFRTRLYDLGPNHWLLVNAGLLRTFRLSADLGRPDMGHCHGVTGWIEHQGLLYIHTDGSLRTELVLKATPAEPASAGDAHLFLMASDAEIQFSSLAALSASFRVEGLRPCTVEFAGLPAKVTCGVTVNNAEFRPVTDERGHLTLPLPASATVTLDARRSRYALVY